MPQPGRAAGSAVRRCASRCDRRRPDAASALLAALIEEASNPVYLPVDADRRRRIAHYLPDRLAAAPAQ